MKPPEIARARRTPKPRFGHLRAAALYAGLSATLAMGCAEQRFTGPPPSESTARTGSTDPSLQAVAGGSPSGSPDATPSSTPTSQPGEPTPSWVDAVRLERWADAATQIDALPDAHRSRPEMRYVRARAAIALGDSARAVTLLTGLAERLPLLADDIVRWRAEAAADAGPHAEAAAYFAQSTKTRDLMRAAEALEKAADHPAARKLADRAVVAAQKAKRPRDEAAARAIRARIDQATGAKATALVDLRWIATKAAGTPQAKPALEVLRAEKQQLTIKEQLDAIGQMTEGGHPDDALAEIERLKKTPAAPQKDLLHARAAALYKKRDYPAAVAAFEAAAAAKSGREAEQLHYAARSLARSTRDADAIKRYREVAARYPSTPWGERSAFYAARLLLQTGKFKEAAAAYTSYLGKFPKGEGREDAEYEMALALLSGGSPKVARRTLAKLAKDAKADVGAKLRQLEGVAALRAGDRDVAIKIWTEIGRAHPLTYAAQVSRARLASLGAPLPPLIEPPVSQAASALEHKLPPAAALLSSLGLDADAENWLLTHEREAAAPHGGRESEALCAMYGTLSRAKRRYRVGNAAVSYASLMRAPSAAERWSWECVYPRPYAERVGLLEAEHDVPSGFVHALMRQESAFDPGVVSPATAVGLMQLMPNTARLACGEMSLDYDASRLTSPDYNLRLGAFYSGKLLKTFDRSLVLAAAAYNAGPQAVSHWLASGADHDVDLFVARIPYEETRNYVAKVMGNLARYQWLQGGDEAVTPIPLALPVDARCEPDAY